MVGRTQVLSVLSNCPKLIPYYSNYNAHGICRLGIQTGHSALAHFGSILSSSSAAAAAASVVSDSVRPHRWQPTRLPRPWDSPGKNTGVGCHFLLQCMKVKSESEVAQVVSDPQPPHGLQPTRLLHPWDFPGRSTGVGCHCLLRQPHYWVYKHLWS